MKHAAWRLFLVTVALGLIRLARFGMPPEEIPPTVVYPPPELPPRHDRQAD